MVRRFRRAVARDPLGLASTLGARRPVADTVAAEILPLLEAARFLERHASRILADVRHGWRGRPLWLGSLRATSRRIPFGAVLILGPSNYPLLLPGVQVLQALVAGNAVALKPGRDGGTAAGRLAALLREAGLPDGLLHVADETDEAGASLVGAGFDRVVLTGSARTGRSVLAEAARLLVPCALELSGSDAVFVLPDADLPLVARCLAYGLRLNDGATCIAPRRVFVPGADAPRLERLLAGHLASLPRCALPPAISDALASLARKVVAAGGRVLGDAAPLVLAGVPARPALLGPDGIGCDLFAPWVALVPVGDVAEALSLDRFCPYALGASVFGPRGRAEAFANRLRAGAITINDVIVPTADPRLGFGGVGESGFGTTRGPEGLIEMTRLQTIASRRRRSFRPHLRPPGPRDAIGIAALAALLHAAPGERFASVRRLLGGAGR